MKIFNRLAGSALALALAASASYAQEYKLKLHHFLSPKAPAHTQMLEPWAKRIEEASGGRVSIEIFPSMTLGGKPPQLPRQARDGVVDLVWIVNAYAAGAFPRTEVFELPGVHQGDNAAVNKAMLAMYEDYLAEDFKGVVPMFQHIHQGQAIHMASDEVRTPADLEGKKIRIPSRTGSWVLEALGAAPVQTAVGEIPVALSKKVIDGALIPFEIIPALKIHEVTDFQIEGPGGKRLGTTSFSVLMNEDRWNSLPDDLKAVFREVSGEDWHAEIGQVWAAADDFGIKVATDSGNTHIQLTDAEWDAFESRIAPVVDRWITEMEAQGIDGKALYDRAVELVGQNMAAN
ncbi:MAG: TRAP transporter substrate-binding protein [Pseudomonadota bacterium]|nr:TRAP transporter substrate-binding protein [Pseudomonadota bacterium]MEE3072154.1 TRAP transporter substrate-binding protein [Pseudomonadota bacterium]